MPFESCKLVCQPELWDCSDVKTWWHGSPPLCNTFIKTLAALLLYLNEGFRAKHFITFRYRVWHGFCYCCFCCYQSLNKYFWVTKIYGTLTFRCACNKYSMYLECIQFIQHANGCRNDGFTANLRSSSDTLMWILIAHDHDICGSPSHAVSPWFSRKWDQLQTIIQNQKFTHIQHASFLWMQRVSASRLEIADIFRTFVIHSVDKSRDTASRKQAWIYLSVVRLRWWIAIEIDISLEAISQQGINIPKYLTVLHVKFPPSNVEQEPHALGTDKRSLAFTIGHRGDLYK